LALLGDVSNVCTHTHTHRKREIVREVLGSVNRGFKYPISFFYHKYYKNHLVCSYYVYHGSEVKIMY